MSRSALAAGVVRPAASATRSIARRASIVADWPVSRLENRSTSLSNRVRISSTVDFRGELEFCIPEGQILMPGVRASAGLDDDARHIVARAAPQCGFDDLLGRLLRSSIRAQDRNDRLVAQSIRDAVGADQESVARFGSDHAAFAPLAPL